MSIGIRIERENSPKAWWLACSKWLILIRGSIVKSMEKKTIRKCIRVKKHEFQFCEELQCCKCSFSLVPPGKSSVKDTSLLKCSSHIFRCVMNYISGKRIAAFRERSTMALSSRHWWNSKKLKKYWILFLKALVTKKKMLFRFFASTQGILGNCGIIIFHWRQSRDRKDLEMVCWGDYWPA